MIASLMVASAALAAAQDTTPWTAYLANQTAAVTWARAVRGPSQFPRFTFDTVVGAVRSLAPGVSAIINIGGPGTTDAAQAAAFFAASQSGNARAWRDTVAARAEAIAGAAGDPGRIVWQISNEINSRGWSQAVRHWQNSGSTSPNDADIIPVYVEHLLAPAVAELRAFAQRRYGDSTRVRIMLGSIANAANPRSREWLQQLLRYRVAGTTTPALRGREVAELVDLVSIHYLVTAASEDWAAILDDLWAQTVRGRVRGIWATEELGAARGNSGFGAATALRATARWLTWARTRYLTADQVRWSLWGSAAGPAGSRGVDGMMLLLQALGDGPVWPLSLGAPIGQEHYLLEADATGRRALVIFGTMQRGRVVINDVPLPAGRLAGAGQARGYVIDAGRIDTIAVAVQRSSDRVIVSFRNPVQLRQQAVLLVELDPR